MKKLIAFFLVFWCAGVVAETSRAHDGAWWISVSADRRTGFLAGYIDCAEFELGETQFAGVSWDAIEPEITNYFNSQTQERGKAVTSELVRFVKKDKTGKNREGGEKYPEKHGIFDGEYWRQSTPDHRLGFLDGYKECQLKRGHPTAVSRHDSAWYASQISLWYGVKADDPGEINARRSNRKIANVISQLEPKQPRSKKQ